MAELQDDATGLDRPLVSIVIVSFNNQAFIAECVDCVMAQEYRPIEVIVVDQNSIDGTRDILRRMPGVKLMENHSNTGFAAGMNRGICEAAGEYVLLLNSDLFLEPSFVSRAVHAFRLLRNERVGMLASIVYRYRAGERTKEIDCLGALLLPYYTAVSIESPVHDQWVCGPAGSAMFLSREMLDNVRLPSGDFLDSTYFCYGEDCELALRAQLLGWRCRFVPIVAGWHIGSGSVNGMHRYSEKPTILLMHALKNRYLSMLSCYPFSLLVRMLGWNALADAGQIAVYTLNGRWRAVRALLGAYRTVLGMLPQTLAKRRWVQSRRRVSYSYLLSLFVGWGFIRSVKSLVKKA